MQTNTFVVYDSTCVTVAERESAVLSWDFASGIKLDYTQ
jgi:hypothetical protein